MSATWPDIVGHAFLPADMGITPELRLDHTAYIEHWLNVMKAIFNGTWQIAKSRTTWKAIRMGGHSAIAEHAMDGKTARKVSVPTTLSLAICAGQWIRQVKDAHKGVFEALIQGFATTHYKHARKLYSGKVVDVSRRTELGFAIGAVLIEGMDEWTGHMAIRFQNENLVARHDGMLRAIVPDLICILDNATAEAITTERLRYGQRVSVLGVSVPEIMRTPEALDVFGPKAFGFDEQFVPIEILAR